MKLTKRKILVVAAIIFAVVVGLAIFNILRHIIYWTPTEQVSFPSNGVQLSGILIKPKEEGIYPAVVMLHGSGPESSNDLAYRVNANALVRRGFAVLIYDKRGVGNSGGDFESASFSDFVDDGIAAVNYLCGRADIANDRIGLFGTSEGAWFTPEIAARSGAVAFIFNRVGPPFSWTENVIWEVRNDFLHDGITEQDVDALVAITQRRWDFYVAVSNDPTLANGEQRASIDAELRRLRETVPNADKVLPERLRDYDEEWYSDFAAEAQYDPRPFLEAIDVPMYYVYGETDINVPTKKAVAYLEKLREEHGKKIEIHVYPGVGHPMFTWKGIFNAGYPPGYLELMSTWSAEQVSQSGKGGEK